MMEPTPIIKLPDGRFLTFDGQVHELEKAQEYEVAALRRVRSADGSQPKPWMVAEEGKSEFYAVVDKADGRLVATTASIEEAEIKAQAAQRFNSFEKPTEAFEKVYLDVPYVEKGLVKALGATWDSEKKSWCARPGVDLEPLGRWMPEQTRAALLYKPEKDLFSKLDLASEQGVINGLNLAVKEQSVPLLNHIAGVVDLSQSDFMSAPLQALIDEVQKAEQEMGLEMGREALALTGKSEEDKDRPEYDFDAAWKNLGTMVHAYAESMSQQQHPGRPEKEAIQEPAPEKTYLEVPFREKEAAKKLGAKWDRNVGLWYAPESADLAPLAKYIPEKTPAPAKEISPELEFAEALRNNGLKLDGLPLINGKIHRVPVVDGKPGNRDGAYCAYADGRPAGWIMNYRTGGDKIKWVATGHTMTVEQKALMALKADERRAEREALRQAAQEEAIKKAVGKWRYEAKSGWGEIDSHPYLAKKEVISYGLKEDLKGNLLVPGYDKDGKLQTIQTINAQGGKFFEPGCPKAGAMHIIGEDEKNGRPEKIRDIKAPQIYISEGYATGASVYLATESPVVMAFDANNLKAVAMAIREVHPEANITICADNDHKNDKNVGLEKAQEAAQAVGGEVIAPEFTPEEMAQGLTDFNDLHQSRGLGAVRSAFQNRQSLGRAAAQIKAAVPKKAMGVGL